MTKRYLEIRRTVEKKIECGEWAVGYKLPREVDLCREFDVSRTTIRRALAALTEEGKLKRIKGTGSFVSRPQVFEKTTLFTYSFAEELRSRGLTCKTEVLELRKLRVRDERVAEGLGVPIGASAVKLKRLRYSAEEGEHGPITLTTSYFPEDIGAQILDCDFEKFSLYQVRKSRRIERAQSTTTISATHLSPRECRWLSANENDLFFLMTSRVCDKDGRVIEYCENYYPIDRNVFTFTVASE
ncbi:MAG: GntR family transcriptional regulator [Clostridia bacterium]|nr:GntR family transcriptional regulator [Clostridia bacterium]